MSMPESRLLMAILLGAGGLALLSPAFLSADNLSGVLLAFSFSAIAALGQLLVILTGRIDLSVGSTIGLSGMVAAMLLTGGFGIPFAACGGIGVGILIGLLNGAAVTYLNINSFIITLAMLQIARGITVGLTQGDTISGFPDAFLFLGAGTLLGLPVPTLIMIALAILFTLLLNLTGAGRELYAIGGNETAARLAGVPVQRLQMMTFIVSGATAGIAGVLLTARLGAAVSNAGLAYELTVIAAAVIGGASLVGGTGTALGVMLGSLLIGLVNNALVLLVVPTYWQQAFIGAVIAVAALIDRMRRG